MINVKKKEKKIVILQHIGAYMISDSSPKQTHTSTYTYEATHRFRKTHRASTDKHRQVLRGRHPHISRETSQHASLLPMTLTQMGEIYRKK